MIKICRNVFFNPNLAKFQLINMLAFGSIFLLKVRKYICQNVSANHHVNEACSLRIHFCYRNLYKKLATKLLLGSSHFKMRINPTKFFFELSFWSKWRFTICISFRFEIRNNSQPYNHNIIPTLRNEMSQ